MKTSEQVCEYIKNNEGFLSFTTEALIGLLPFEHAKAWLKADAKEADWKQDDTSDAAVLAVLTDYMAFAWGKVEDHRGISAGRSVEKCTAWAWYLRGDDILSEIEAAEYAQYGAPKLAVICRALNLNIPADPQIQRMINGEPCSPGCESGCGQ